ncbi:hypothetical protein BH18ACT15_BH18ACT15_13470 [soil metagenome]
MPFSPRSAGTIDCMPEIPLSESPSVTIEEPEGSLELLGSAASYEEMAAVAAQYPSCLAAWASLGENALADGRPVDAYAYFRVGYHRGLDRIRRAGWRGMGQVPRSHDGNRGFLRALGGLGRAADELGEKDEAQRCAEFLEQLAPDLR